MDNLDQPPSEDIADGDPEIAKRDRRLLAAIYAASK